MKKFLGILVLGLFWCGTVISAEKNINKRKKRERQENIKRSKKIKRMRDYNT